MSMLVLMPMLCVDVAAVLVAAVDAGADADGGGDGGWLCGDGDADDAREDALLMATVMVPRCRAGHGMR
eukprot:15272594-Alexandrium_andersonii.AAC.1